MCTQAVILPTTAACRYAENSNAHHCCGPQPDASQVRDVCVSVSQSNACILTDHRALRLTSLALPQMGSGAVPILASRQYQFCFNLVQALHGDIAQSSRERVLKRFREGKTLCLVATDVAARGLDIPNVDLVVHYELPNVRMLSFQLRCSRSGSRLCCVRNVTLPLHTLQCGL